MSINQIGLAVNSTICEVMSSKYIWNSCNGNASNQNVFQRFMSDQEAWHELCGLYLAEGDYSKAVFCMEELLLYNPHSHLIHQRIAEIRYTMVIICLW